MAGAPRARVAPAPWRSTFVSHINEMQSPEFVLSTLHPVDQGNLDPSSAPPAAGLLQVTPRARTVIYRGMWACLDLNPKNTAEPNRAAVYETDLPTITSDARMEKVPELFGTRGTASAGAVGAAAPEPGQSGCGGPVEAVFWASKQKTQWRMRGRAYVIGPDIDSDDAEPVRAALARHMRLVAGSATDDDHNNNNDAAGTSWSWSRELTAQFGNLSPGMRGSFKNPPPGTPVSRAPPPGEGLGLGQKVEDLHDEVARRNFRVVVVVPEEVDQVDLTDPERGRRWNHRLAGERWETTEVWP